MPNVSLSTSLSRLKHFDFTCNKAVEIQLLRVALLQQYYLQYQIFNYTLERRYKHKCLKSNANIILLYSVRGSSRPFELII